jgi:hypothetical protein
MGFKGSEVQILSPRPKKLYSYGVPKRTPFLFGVKKVYSDLKLIRLFSKEACAPLAHSNQPEADKSPAIKQAGKSAQG